MATNAALANGKGKRTKRDGGAREKRGAKRQELDDGTTTYNRKTTASVSSLAIPPFELSMSIPIPLADPRPIDILHPRPRQMNPAFTTHSESLQQSWAFFDVADKVSNRNGFRYSYAVADPRLSHILYRQTDVPPYHSRFSFEDSPSCIAFSKDGLAVSTKDPWHSARANVCAREGTYYYEARVISGIIRGKATGTSPRGNVRLGFGRREADLDVNVGVDCYGYGIRDVNGEVVNRMRCEYFFPKDESINEGDVIGMLITLPPLSVHKKIVEGTYDVSTDINGDTSMQSNGAPKPPAAVNFIRDRIPFHLKSDFLYQQNHVFPSKHLRDYAFNLKETPTYGPPSPGNVEDPSLRTLPGSSITIYKNGVRMGTPFTNLYAFLPPASRATQAANNLGIGERENADDGMIGYYPMVSCHNGGAVECRFEKPWWVGPPDVPDLKPFGERFNEQIVEDVVADIVDEIDAISMGWSVTDALNATVGPNTAVGSVPGTGPPTAVSTPQTAQSVTGDMRMQTDEVSGTPAPVDV
ncbi:transcription factor, contains a PHD finger motif [Ophidiomyces ophidiicola]|nr:transcription factor, contains a PHD finger motif [Ophidiomyces ophidiicola]KAI1989102.1 transcription factor, contains a PHD finger motif [Ophidiomyces ophidiicola]KAI1989572.1 transcription factor, contains a PHD finger motif [Ophidiomyces ophidiicola]KAI2003530.1 transcription factor, contains a PHD finger motif [Ophidiomyces ophidiicola]